MNSVLSTTTAIARGTTLFSEVKPKHSAEPLSMNKESNRMKRLQFALSSAMLMCVTHAPFCTAQSNAQIQIDNPRKNQDVFTYEFVLANTEVGDIFGVYIDNKDATDIFKNKAEISRNGASTIIKIMTTRSISGNRAEFYTRRGIILRSLIDALRPSLANEKIVSPSNYAVSNTVTIAGRIMHRFPSGWFGCSNYSGSGAYVQAYRTISPSTFTSTYANSSGDYTMTFGNQGGTSVLVTAKLLGSSNYQRINVCSSGNCAYTVNLTIYDQACI